MGIFDSIPLPKIKRSVHNLTYVNCFSAQFGRVYPVMCRKVVPSDRFKLMAQTFVQFQTMATKVYQDFVCRQSFFFVPSRLVWEEFEDFYSINEEETHIHPYFNYQSLVALGVCSHGSLFDYFNLPTFWFPEDYDPTNLDASRWTNHEDDKERIANILARNNNREIYHLDALPFLAYVKIYSDWFADENLQESFADWKSIFKQIQTQIIQGDGDLTTYVVQLDEKWRQNYYNKNYPKDYFTGALPFAQKGPRVRLPFTGSGDVYSYIADSATSQNRYVVARDTTSELPPYVEGERAQGLSGRTTLNGDGYAIRQRAFFENGLTTIEDLRSAMMLQQFYERNARSGTRYKETILAHFGFLTPDARLDRSQFIQDISTPVSLGSVYSTSANSEGSGITGEPVSFATGAGFSKRRKFKIDEHGYIISLWCAYPRASYYKGIPREFMELDKFDYFWPDFQNLGEQGIKIAELSVGNASPTTLNVEDGGTFGYVPRYSQYKIATNQIHGDFRDKRKAMSDARDFPAGQTLSSAFTRITVGNNNLNRVFNYTEEDWDPIDVSILFKIEAHRPMDYHGVPRF